MKLFFCVAVVFATMGPTFAQSLRSQLEKTDREVSRAMMNKDSVRMAKLFKSTVTPDFQYVEAGKSMNADEMVAHLSSGINAIQKIKMAKATILSLKQMGNKAVGKTEYAMAGSIVGPDKKMHQMYSSGITDETFEKVGSTWKTKKMVWGHQKMTIDGKPFKYPNSH